MMVNLSWEKFAYVLAMEIEKCDHQEGHKFIRTFSSASGIILKHSRTFMEAPRYPKQRTFVHQFRGGGGGGGAFKSIDTLTVSDLFTVTKSSNNKTLNIYLLAI